MSFQDVRPYFRARVEAVGGLQEWTDGFNFDNIPSTILDGSYHLDSGSFSNIKQNQDCLDASGTFTVRVFLKGFRDPQDGIDRGWAKGQAIVQECLKASNRATQAGIKNVQLLTFAVEPLDVSNDNVVRTVLSFTVTIVLDIPGV